MSTEELNAIADEMTGLLGRFVNGDLPADATARFKALGLEAKSLIDDALTRVNDFSIPLLGIVNAPTYGLLSGPGHSSVQQACELVRGAVRTIERRRVRPAAAPIGAKPYVAAERIAALQALRSSPWDFTRLAELCREINVAAANRCHMSTAMLLRTILNHVPPVLGFGTFEQVANNYGGPKDQKSFKQTMQRLQGSLRAIADMHLHSPIRQQEDVPTGVQVDFAAELDVLLGEVLRVARSG